MWFELESGEHEGTDIALTLGSPPGSAPTGAPAGVVEVELGNVPLLLHVAWHQHAETLLRESLLHGLTQDDDDLSALQAHAGASAAIGLLLEHLPDPGVGDDPDELMTTAVEPAVTSARLVLPLSVDAIANFRVLDELIETALDLADSGAFLTPPTQPEIRAFRRWVCREVAVQAVGGRPSGWVDVTDAAPPSVASQLSWAPRAVSDSASSQIAADDTNRILAVSRSALRLLGYEDEEELVGRRLVAIIPARYRQAHVAGFTLFLSNGRAPMLGRPVTVPALRRDGSELELSLTIAAHPLPDGRHLFVTDIHG